MTCWSPCCTTQSPTHTPRSAGEGNVNGFGLEFFLETPASEIGVGGAEVKASWQFQLLFTVCQLAAGHGGIAGIIDDLTLLSTEAEGVAEALPEWEGRKQHVRVCVGGWGTHAVDIEKCVSCCYYQLCAYLFLLPTTYMFLLPFTCILRLLQRIAAFLVDWFLFFLTPPTPPPTPHSPTHLPAPHAQVNKMGRVGAILGLTHPAGGVPEKIKMPLNDVRLVRDQSAMPHLIPMRWWSTHPPTHHHPCTRIKSSCTPSHPAATPLPSHAPSPAQIPAMPSAAHPPATVSHARHHASLHS